MTQPTQFYADVGCTVNGVRKAVVVSGLDVDRSVMMSVAAMCLQSMYCEIFRMPEFERFMQALVFEGDGSLLSSKQEMFRQVLDGLSYKHFVCGTIETTDGLIGQYRLLRDYVCAGGDESYIPQQVDASLFEEVSEVVPLSGGPRCFSELEELDDQDYVVAAVGVLPALVVSFFFCDSLRVDDIFSEETVIDCRNMKRHIFLDVLSRLRRDGDCGDHYTLVVNDRSFLGHLDTVVGAFSRASLRFLGDFRKVRRRKYYQLLIAASVCSYFRSFYDYASCVRDMVHGRPFVRSCSHATEDDPFPHGFCFLNLFERAWWPTLISEFPDGFMDTGQIRQRMSGLVRSCDILFSPGCVNHVSISSMASCTPQDLLGFARILGASSDYFGSTC